MSETKYTFPHKLIDVDKINPLKTFSNNITPNEIAVGMYPIAKKLLESTPLAMIMSSKLPDTTKVSAIMIAFEGILERQGITVSASPLAKSPANVDGYDIVGDFAEVR